jgi:cytochrome c biogenesis protein CcmG/thiol:disulfide interchange protein DsbE
LIISVVVLVAIVGLSILLVTRQPVSATSVPSALVGRAAPDIRGSRFGGGTFSLKSERGKIVVVNFFASWCGPCQVEEPNLITFAWQQHLKGIVVLGVVFNDTINAAQAFDAKWGSGQFYPTIADPNGSFAFHYGVTSPPSTFVIDAHGRVVAELLGPVSAAQLNNLVARVRA